MGSVWRAKQVRLRSPVAIKFLDPTLIEVPEMLERFLQEARSAAAVQSAHVIQVFDYGSHGGLPYIAMELLEGENLASRLATRGVLSADELSKIFSEVARGLGQAHALGVIHRDVKPGNIFLAREGRHEVTKLIDFGIAKVKADALRVSQIVGTDLGIVMGTPQYMSPEQMRGWTVDHRTDLWALAVIACECLTGRCPFSGTTLADLTVQICTEQPLAPSALGNVPVGFDEWFFRGTHKEPSERFESASEMADALETVLAPATVRRRGRRWAPLGRDLQHACALASRRVQRASSSVLDGAAEGAARYAALLHGTLRGMSRAVASQLPLRPEGWRGLGVAAVGVAVLVVIGSQGLARYRQGSPAPTISREAQAALPSPASRAASPAAAEQRNPAPPVVTLEDLPLAPATQTDTQDVQRPPPARAPEDQRRSKRPSSTVASSERDDSPTPSSPMSEAMVRIGALIAQGGDRDKSRPASSSAGAKSPSAQTKSLSAQTKSPSAQTKSPSGAASARSPAPSVGPARPAPDEADSAR